MDKILVQFLSYSARILEKPCNLKGMCKSRSVVSEIPNQIKRKLSPMSENSSNSQKFSASKPGCMCCLACDALPRKLLPMIDNNPSTQNSSKDEPDVCCPASNDLHRQSMEENNPNSKNFSASQTDCVCCPAINALHGQSGSTSDHNLISQDVNPNINENLVYCFSGHLSSNVSFQNFPHLFQQPSLSAINLIPLPFNCRPSICRQPLLCHNFVEMPFNQERFYHKERQDHYGSPRKKKGHDIMSLRMWESVPTGKLTTKPGFIFTVMSYNVLAQDLLMQHPELYRHHDKEALMWEARWQNIFEEIKKLSPDILCLQEVQESHISEYFDLLKTIGYQGVYKKRTGIRIDGCAIYYKLASINLVEYTEVEYFQPPVELLNRDNVGLVAKFSPKMHPNRDFVVATTHLLYNPRRHDVRMAQVQLLLAEIDRLCFKYGERKPYVPVIVTGDLNTSPDSDLYRFITTGELRYEELAPKLVDRESRLLVTSTLGISDSCQHMDTLGQRLNNVCVTEKSSVTVFGTQSKTCPKQSLSKKTLSHHFAFRSVYDHASSAYSEATTYQDGWVTVDYIFYSAKNDRHKSEDKIKLLKRYRLPTSDELAGIKIPNKGYGSDHLSIIGKFKLEF